MLLKRKFCALEMRKCMTSGQQSYFAEEVSCWKNVERNGCPLASLNQVWKGDAIHIPTHLFAFSSTPSASGEYAIPVLIILCVQFFFFFF